MKITKLVILFNKDKIIIGVLAAGLAFLGATNFSSPWSMLLMILAGLILLNIALAILASYLLYDKSNLYKPAVLFKKLQLNYKHKAILLHASFDPVSQKFEKLVGSENLKIYNLYGNRHEDESAIKISNKYFPPHPNEITVDPTKLPDDSDSLDYIFAITSLHEILEHEKRVKFFREAKRTLKPGGQLIICEQLRSVVNFVFFNIGAFHFVSERDWRSAIAEAEMQILEVEDITVWGKVFYAGEI